LSEEEVGRELGAGRDEIVLLHQGGIFKARKLDKIDYSKAWIPGETKRDAV
jgi:hypothetical protein